ncbi:BQ2448_1410 [Microbotryum intermedium]|uniref:ATP-dependent DNA helicase n=1 Tax=Microbotryum intermedium TaxID=269621 RepID=A0A238FG55_9BASI|nr:BQ2448_1410 [Microbotryum intermedium]
MSSGDEEWIDLARSAPHTRARTLDSAPEPPSSKSKSQPLPMGARSTTPPPRAHSALPLGNPTTPTNSSAMDVDTTPRARATTTSLRRPVQSAPWTGGGAVPVVRPLTPGFRPFHPESKPRGSPGNEAKSIVASTVPTTPTRPAAPMECITIESSPLAASPSKTPLPTPPPASGFSNNQSFVPLSGSASTPASTALSPQTTRTKEQIEAQKAAAKRRQLEVAERKAREQAEKQHRELAHKSLAEWGHHLSPKRGQAWAEMSAAMQTEFKDKETVWRDNPMCSHEQLEVLNKAREGRNVFFTGSAGVGKSFLLQEIRRLIKFQNREYATTAPTGIAALQIGGSTIQSWAGIGIGKENLMTLYDKLGKGKRKQWRETHALIIDEISMVDPELFTKLDLLGKLLRSNKRPFGGLQMIVSGDFFQSVSCEAFGLGLSIADRTAEGSFCRLPPVPDSHPQPHTAPLPITGETTFTTIPLTESHLPYEEAPKGVSPYEVRKCVDGKRNAKIIKGCHLEVRVRKFAFETEAWAECDFHVMELTKEIDFRWFWWVMQVFRQSDMEFIRVLEMFRRGKCDDEAGKLIKTCGYGLDPAAATGNIKPTNLYATKKDVATENRTNFDRLGGPIIDYVANDEKWGDGAGIYMKRVRSKCAGCCLNDCPAPDKLRLRVGAQVMLITNLSVSTGLVNGSRGVVVDFIDLSHPPLNDPDDRAAPKALRACNQSHQKYPVVYFISGEKRVLGPHTWTIDIDKYNSISRSQIPLALAWALTIVKLRSHKSQGQTLDAVTVRLDKTFEKGQAYVALSRCRTISGMKVDGFEPRKIMAHPTVLTFYDRIAQGKPLQMLSVFGRPADPVPQGSAVLAPGQRPPSESIAQTTANATPLKSTPTGLAPLVEIKPANISAKASLTSNTSTTSATTSSATLTTSSKEWEESLREAIDAHLNSTSGNGSQDGSSETSRQRFLDRAKEMYDESRVLRKRERAESVASVSSGAGGEAEEGTLDAVDEVETEGTGKVGKPGPKRKRSHRVGR